MTDNVPHTLGLDYATLGTPRAIRDRLASFGVTHVGVSDATDQDSLGAELLFRAFVVLGTRPLQVVAGWRLASLEPGVSETPAPFVLVAGCGTPLADGLYSLAQLSAPLPAAGHTPELPSPRASGVFSELVERAGYVAVDPRCAPPLDPSTFETLGVRDGLSLFLRRATVR